MKTISTLNWAFAAVFSALALTACNDDYLEVPGAANNDPKGFQWINCDDADRSIFSFMRKSKDGKNNLLFVCNFTPMARPDYAVGAPCAGTYTLVLDNVRGHVGYKEPNNKYVAVEGECDRQPYRINYPLPAYGVAVFKFNIKETATKETDTNTEVDAED